MARLTFISDLHLGPRPGPAGGHFRALCSALAGRQGAGEAQALYVLGDLFSFWVERRRVAERVHGGALSALRSLAAAGCEVAALEGNRDFGLGRVFRELSGAATPGERLVVAQSGRSALLLHGDQLLTADRRYQLFRRLVRSWPARMAARALPSPLLLWAVRRLEGFSEREKAAKPPASMLVDPAAAARELEAAGAELLVYGHTHQSGAWEVEAAGRSCPAYALGRWGPEGGTLLDWPEGGEPRILPWPQGGANGEAGRGKNR